MENIKIIAYKKYQWDWLMSHNYSIDDLSDVQMIGLTND